MSVILLSMTGLFLRSLENRGQSDLGFRPQNVLSMSVDPRVHGYTPEQTVEFLNQLRERLAASAGCGLGGVPQTIRHSPSPATRSRFTAARGPTPAKTIPGSIRIMVTPGYFETMGIPRVAGRDFGGETASGAKTAVVNRAFVERFFRGENPIGQQVTGGGATYQIVGVVGNVKTQHIGRGS